jgi:hypothetical protein
MMQFQGFKPEAQKRIAGKLGYTGDMSNFDGYLEQNPEAKQQMDTYNQQAVKMMQGGMVRKNYQEGGTVPQIKQDTIDRMATGAVPAGAEVKGVGVATDALKDTFISTSQQNQGIKDSSGKAVSGTITQQQQLTPGQVAERRREDGQQTAEVVEGVRGTAPTVAKASDTDTDATDANLIATEDLRMAQDDVKEDVLDKQKSATLTTTTESDSMITAEESEKDVEGNVKTSVSNLDAAQGTAVKVDSPAARQIQDGEIIDGVADAQKAAKFTEQIQAAEATPSKQATVKGQLESLMQDFEGGETPPWAAGAMRNVSAQMAARGLGASSMAGQALVQAAMESSLPIAMADAQTVAGFEMANLSNRQQRSMLAAEQRAAFMGQEFDQDFQARVLVASKITDIANMNFTAEQQIALENSRAANTMELANTSNKQALVMGEAAALSNLDMANLNNRQQAAVQNAQTFLSTDMANLSNEQQVELFKGQTRSQSLFSDQAAENAALQFNATSENQTDQFFSNLKVQNNQFNTAQDNAMKQFNAGDESAMSKFNAEVANQRDQFNATNQLVVAQANAGWRREIATAETATINRVNEINASNVLATSNQGYANLWQEHGDLMEWAWTSAEGERDRQNAVTLSHLAAGRERTQAEYEADLASSAAIGDFVGKLLLGSFGF